MFDAVPRPDYNAGRVDLSQIAGLSGRAYLQELMDGNLPAPSMGLTMNAWLHRLDEGEAEFRGEPGAGHLNPLGLVHGGWAMSLLDSALGCAVHTTCAPGEGFVSMDTSVKFIRPLLPDMGQLRCIATVQSRGRTIANVSGQIEDQKGKLLALGTSTCFIQKLPG